RRELHERLLDVLEYLLRLDLLRRIAFGLAPESRRVLHQGDCLKCPGLTQTMLVQDVIRNGKEVGLRVANRLVVLDSQEPKVHLLHEVWRVGRGISQARGQKAAQASAM